MRTEYNYLLEEAALSEWREKIRRDKRATDFFKRELESVITDKRILERPVILDKAAEDMGVLYLDTIKEIAFLYESAMESIAAIQELPEMALDKEETRYDTLIEID